MANGARNALPGEMLTLQEAADRLKVHYMTAYRWVRKGDLTAFKTGGRLRIRAGDLDRFLVDRQVEVALPSPSPRRTDWSAHVDRLHQLLLHGKAVEAGSMVRKVIADGAPAGEVYIHLLTPALHQIGEDWAAGRAGVAVEHRATEICSGLMARLGEYFRRRGPARGVAVTMTPPGEQHGLPAAMVADFLRAGGWDVHHLGASVPVEDLRLFLRVVPTQLLCVSVTTPGLDPELLRDLVHAARRASDCVVVVGGQQADPERVGAAGAVHLDDLVTLTARVDELMPA